MTEPLWNITRHGADDLVFVDSVRGLLHERPDGSVAITDKGGAVRALYAGGSWSVIERVEHAA